jgi:hypothetical protein
LHLLQREFEIGVVEAARGFDQLNDDSTASGIVSRALRADIEELGTGTSSARAKRSRVRKLGSDRPRSIPEIASTDRSTRSANSSCDIPRRLRASFIRCPTRRLSVIPGEFSGNRPLENVLDHRYS